MGTSIVCLLKRMGVGGIAILLGVQGVLAYQPEKSFWEARRGAARDSRGGALAFVSRTSNSSSSLVHEFPAIQSVRSSLSSSLGRALPDSFLNRHRGLLAALSPVYGTVRKVWAGPSSGRGRVVVHIQDVHQNLEAQWNIRGAVSELLKSGQVGVVALEGSTETIDLKPFVNFPHRKAVEMAADYFLKENRISGPIHAALTAQGPLPLIQGIDDPAHYEANVKAVRDSLPKADEIRHSLIVRQNEIEKKKAVVFSPALLSLDRTVTDYRAEKIPLGNYVEILFATSPLPSVSLNTFLHALKTERTLDFKLVETERSRLMEKLIQTLSPAEINSLTAESLAYRSGQRRFAEFYEGVKLLCRNHGIRLGDYPAMDAYVRYVLSVDGIDPDTLMKDMARLEKRTFARLARTSEEQALIVRSRQTWLAGRLVDLALTPSEWEEWASNPLSLSINLSAFESFYREAHARDGAMAENLWAAMKENDVAVLVTGGFHADRLDRQLVRRGATVIAYVPKITKVDTAQGAAYLSVFTQEKTPLEKLFRGEKLFLSANPIATAELKIQLPLVVMLVALLTVGNLDPQLLYQVLGGIGTIQDVVTGAGYAQAAVALGAGALIFRCVLKGNVIDQVVSFTKKRGLGSEFKIKVWDPLREQVKYFLPWMILIPFLLSLVGTNFFDGGLGMLVCLYLYLGFSILVGMAPIFIEKEHIHYSFESKFPLFGIALRIGVLTMGTFILTFALLAPMGLNLIDYADQFYPLIPNGNLRAFLFATFFGFMAGLLKHVVHNEKTYGHFLKMREGHLLDPGEMLPLSRTASGKKTPPVPAFSQVEIDLPPGVSREAIVGGEWGASVVAMVWHLVSDGIFMARHQYSARRESRRVGAIIVHPAPRTSTFLPEGGPRHVEDILGPSRGSLQFGARAQIELASDARREREPPFGPVINEADLRVEARPSVKYEGIKYLDSYGLYFREKILTLSVLQSLSPDQALEVVLIVSRELEESFGNELFKESLPEYSPNARLDLLVLQSRAILSYLNIAPKVSPPLAQMVARWVITSAHSNTPFSVDVVGALLRTNLESVEPESQKLLGYYFPIHAKGTIPDEGIQQRVMAKFTVNNVSTARAARGFMETMGWNDASVIIGYAGEMDESTARKYFPLALVEADRISSPRDLPHIRFSDGETMVPLRESESFRWLVPIAPFKSVLPEVPFSRGEEIRGQLRAGNRKIFVIGSPAARKEMEEPLRAIWPHSELSPTSEPPLILIAPNSESELSFILHRFKDKRFIVRRNENDKFPDMSKADVLIVLSRGELLDLYATADVSIVGTDRNIMEPASQGKPVFFFNTVPWEKNITAMELLWKEGGALPFDGDSFVRVLQNGPTLLEMGKRAKDTARKMKSLARDRAVAFGISYSFKQILKIRGKHLTLRFRRGGDSESHPSTQEIAATWVVSKVVGYAVALMGIAGGMAVLGVPWTVIFENPVRAGLIGVGLIPLSTFLASTVYIAALLEAWMLHRDLKKWILWHGVAVGSQEYDTLREVGLKLREIGRQQGLMAELFAHNGHNLRFYRARFLSFWSGLNVNEDDRLAEAIYKWMPMARGQGPLSLRRALTLAVTNLQVDLGAVAQSIVGGVSGRSILSTGIGAENWTLAGLGVNTKAKALIPLTTELLQRDDLPNLAQKALLLHPAGLVFFIPSGSKLPDLFKKYLEEKGSRAMLVEADLFVDNFLRMAEVENKTPRSVRDVTPYVPEGIAVNYEGVHDVSRFGEKAVRPLGLLYSIDRILRLIEFIAHFA